LLLEGAPVSPFAPQRPGDHTRPLDHHVALCSYKDPSDTGLVVTAQVGLVPHLSPQS